MEFQTIDSCFDKLESTPTGNISARIDILNEARDEVARLDQNVQRLEKSFSELEVQLCHFAGITKKGLPD